MENGCAGSPSRSNPRPATQRSGPREESRSGKAGIPPLPAARNNGTKKFVGTRNFHQPIIGKSRRVGAGVRNPHRLLRHSNYGQGLSASAPGMVHGAILEGASTGRPSIRFSGNGKMEPEMADLLAELDPSVYVLDCCPWWPIEIKERVEPCVHNSASRIRTRPSCSWKRPCRILF